MVTGDGQITVSTAVDISFDTVNDFGSAKTVDRGRSIGSVIAAAAAGSGGTSGIGGAVEFNSNFIRHSLLSAQGGSTCNAEVVLVGMSSLNSQIGILTAEDVSLAAVGHQPLVCAGGVTKGLAAGQSGGGRTVEGHGGCSGKDPVDDCRIFHGEVSGERAIIFNGQIAVGTAVNQRIGGFVNNSSGSSGDGGIALVAAAQGKSFSFADGLFTGQVSSTCNSETVVESPGKRNCQIVVSTAQDIVFGAVVGHSTGKSSAAVVIFGCVIFSAEVGSVTGDSSVEDHVNSCIKSGQAGI